MKLRKTILYFFLLTFFSGMTFAHKDQEERIKFWKEYYNPKVEVTQEKVPEIKINLQKICVFNRTKNPFS